MGTETTTRQRKATTTPANNDNDDDAIPEDILEFKEKLEKRTGKAYRYRAPKKDLPSVNDLLKTGATDKETLNDEVIYLAVLVFFFLLSLYGFHVFVSPIV